MVVKLPAYPHILPILFESSVISYGSKTSCFDLIVLMEFESSVISYGSKTIAIQVDDFTSLRVV